MPRRKRAIAPVVNADFPLWRIRNGDTDEYWDQGQARWVKRGTALYTVWTNVEWLKRFGPRDGERNWESFGWPIPLYDDNEVTND